MSGTGDGAGLMADRAYDRLIGMLRGGDLRSGSFLSMPGLVTTLDFPLSAVREAVKRAEARGLLQVLPKRGVMVMSANPQMTRDCLDMRAVLDSEGARRLVRQVAGPDLTALRAAHVAILAALAENTTPELPTRAKATDLSLHDVLTTGLKNGFLRDAYAANRDRISIIQNTRPFLLDRISSAMQEHLAIIDALIAKDAEAAVAAIWHHNAQTLRWWGVAG